MYFNQQYLRIFLIASVLLVASMVSQSNAENTSEPEQQTSGRDSPEDLVCEKDSKLVWTTDGSMICVKSESVLNFVDLGLLHSETIDRISVSDKREHEISENVYAFQFDYCAGVYNEGVLGVIVSSDTEKIPVPIDLSIQIGQCQQYGTQIRAFSVSSIDVSLFYEKDMERLTKVFDKKKGNLGDDLVHYHQKLLRLEDPNLDEDNLDEIDRLKMRIDLINHVIQSYKEGLNTLRALQ